MGSIDSSNTLRQRKSVHLDFLIAAASRLRWKDLVRFSNSSSVGKDAVSRILHGRLSFLVCRFISSDDFWPFIQLLSVTNGCIVGDVPSRLTHSCQSVFNPKFSKCLTAHCLTIVVSSRLNMVYIMTWFKAKGFVVWRGTGIKNGKMTEETSFIVGSWHGEALLTGRSIAIAYGDGIKSCIMPCKASQDVAVITPARVYKARPPFSDIQSVAWNDVYQQDPPRFRSYAIRECSRWAADQHQCWNPECPQRDEHFEGKKFAGIECECSSPACLQRTRRFGDVQFACLNVSAFHSWFSSR